MQEGKKNRMASFASSVLAKRPRCCGQPSWGLVRVLVPGLRLDLGSAWGLQTGKETSIWREPNGGNDGTHPHAEEEEDEQYQ